MAYKALGFVVWQGAKLYLRRRTNTTALKLGLGVAAALMVGGAVVAQRQQASSK